MSQERGFLKGARKGDMAGEQRVAERDTVAQAGGQVLPARGRALHFILSCKGPLL